MLTNLLIAGLTLIIGIVATQYYSNRRSISFIAGLRKVLDPVGGKHPSEVEIIFNGVKVASLDEWTIIVWNSGNQTISDSEVAERVRFIFGKDLVLKTSDPFTSRVAIRPNLEIVESAVELSFDFLDKNDYVMFTTYVVPPPPEDDEMLRWDGVIRGIPHGLSDRSYFSPLMLKDILAAATSIIISLVMFSISATIFLLEGHRLGFWSAEYTIDLVWANRTTGSWPLFLTAPFVMALFAFGGAMTARALWRALILVPKVVRNQVASPSWIRYGNIDRK